MAHHPYQQQHRQPQHFLCSIGPSIRESAILLRRTILDHRPRARGLPGLFWCTKMLDCLDLGVLIGLIGIHGFLQLLLNALS